MPCLTGLGLMEASISLRVRYQEKHPHPFTIETQGWPSEMPSSKGLSFIPECTVRWLLLYTLSTEGTVSPTIYATNCDRFRDWPCSLQRYHSWKVNEIGLKNENIGLRFSDCGHQRWRRLPLRSLSDVCVHVCICGPVCVKELFFKISHFLSMNVSRLQIVCLQMGTILCSACSIGPVLLIHLKTGQRFWYVQVLLDTFWWF